MVRALAGGALIGLSVAMLLLLNGQIAGISGMLRRALSEPRKGAVPIAFLFGMLVVGIAVRAWNPAVLPSTSVPLPLVVAGSFLVGCGASWANGCTSGHAVCGTGRLSPRSIVATTLFVLVGMVTVTALRHLTGGS